MFGLLQHNSYKKNYELANEFFINQLKNINGFILARAVISTCGKTALGIDEQNNLMCLLLIGKDSTITYRILSTSELISAEIVTGKKSSSQVTGNAIGGALIGSMFGGAGAMIGANVAGNKAAMDIENIRLVLKINDIKCPYYPIFFTKLGRRDIRAMTEARKWLGILDIMAKRAESGQISAGADSGWVVGQVPIRVIDEPHQLPDRTQEPQNQSIQANVTAAVCELRSAASPNSYPVRVDQPVFTIGRAMTNDLILEDPKVSRQHAVLRFMNDGWVLQDQNSTGGVFVNGKRIHEKSLRSGDQIQVGSAVFIFRDL